MAKEVFERFPVCTEIGSNQIYFGEVVETGDDEYCTSGFGLTQTKGAIHDEFLELKDDQANPGIVLKYQYTSADTVLISGYFNHRNTNLNKGVYFPAFRYSKYKKTLEIDNRDGKGSLSKFRLVLHTDGSYEVLKLNSYGNFDSKAVCFKHGNLTLQKRSDPYTEATAINGYAAGGKYETHLTEWDLNPMYNVRGVIPAYCNKNNGVYAYVGGVTTIANPPSYKVNSYGERIFVSKVDGYGLVPYSNGTYLGKVEHLDKDGSYTRTGLGMYRYNNCTAYVGQYWVNYRHSVGITYLNDHYEVNSYDRGELSGANFLVYRDYMLVCYYEKNNYVGEYYKISFDDFSVTKMLDGKVVTKIDFNTQSSAYTKESVVTINPSYVSELKFLNYSYRVESGNKIIVTGCTNPDKVIAHIPSFIDTVVSGAFSECKKLTTVLIYKGVKRINSGAFEGCKKLEQVAVESGSTLRICENAFPENRSLAVYAPKSVTVEQSTYGKKVYVSNDESRIKSIFSRYY